MFKRSRNKSSQKHSSAAHECSNENFIMIQLTISKRRNEKTGF